MTASPTTGSPSDARNKALLVINRLKEQVATEQAKSTRLLKQCATAESAFESLKTESATKIASLEKALAYAQTTDQTATALRADLEARNATIAKLEKALADAQSAPRASPGGDDEELEALRTQLDKVLEENEALHLEVQQLKVLEANERWLKRQLAIAEEDGRRMAGELEEMDADTQALRKDLEGEIQQLKQRLAAQPAPAPTGAAAGSAELEKAALKADSGARAEKELAALTAKLADAEAGLAGEIEKAAALREESAAAQARLSADLAKAKADLEKANGEIAAQGRLAADLAEAKADLEKANAEIAAQGRLAVDLAEAKAELEKAAVAGPGPELTTAKAEIARLREERAATEADLEKVKAELQEANDALDAERRAKDTELEALSRKEAQFALERDENAEKATRLASEKDELLSQLSELRKSVEQSSAEGLLSKRRLAEVELKLAESQAAYQALAEQAEADRAIFLSQKSELSKLRQTESSDKVTELERRVDDLTGQNEELSFKLRSAEAENAQFVEKSSSLRQELKQKEDAISELKTHNASFVEQLRGKADAEVLQAEVATLRRTAEELNAKLAKVSRECSDVKRKLRTKPPNPVPAPKPGMFEHEYVKTSLLQFFEQDNRTRGEMIPIILQFLGCRDEEIHNAMSSWSRSHSSFVPSFARCSRLPPF
jgi:chromosome segregation ATPase